MLAHHQHIKHSPSPRHEDSPRSSNVTPRRAQDKLNTRTILSKQVTPSSGKSKSNRLSPRAQLKKEVDGMENHLGRDESKVASIMPTLKLNQSLN